MVYLDGYSRTTNRFNKIKGQFMKVYPAVCVSCATCIYNRRGRAYYCDLTKERINELSIFNLKGMAEGFPEHCPLEDKK
jgi:hypothetical protein